MTGGTYIERSTVWTIRADATAGWLWVYLKTISRDRLVRTSLRRIAGDLGMTIKQVRGALDRLEAKGIIETSQSWQGTQIHLIYKIDEGTPKGTPKGTPQTESKGTPQTAANDFISDGYKGGIENKGTPQTNIKGTPKGTHKGTHINNIDYNIDYKENNTTNVVFKESAREEKPKNKVWVKPTIQEIADYIQLKGYTFNAEAFYYHYESNGWMVGRTHMKDWHAACQTWQHRETTTLKTQQNGRKNETTREQRAAEAMSIVEQLLREDQEKRDRAAGGM